MTSGTDELLRLLDERGVEWTYEDGTVSFNDGKRWFHAWAYNDGAMCVSMGYLTPAQAIAATLGPAARHPKPHEKWTTVLLPEIAWSWYDSWPDYLSVAHDTHGEWRMYVPEARLLEAMDAAREAGRRADMAERVAADHKGLCDSLRETNDDLRRIIDELRVEVGQ